MLAKRFILFFVLGVSLSGCATYEMKVAKARSDIMAGKAGEAANFLEPLATKEGDDQLVYLFEYGTALQLAEKYKESNDVFLKADKMSEVKDYHSLTRIAGSMLLSEGMVQYKGEDYEKVMINALSAINYLMLNQPDEAAVEARRLNEKLNHYRNDAKKPWQQSALARYLSAMIWESAGRYDDAYIDYEECYRLDPEISLLPGDLIRMSKKSRRTDAYEKWSKLFPTVKYVKEWDDSSYGEIVLIYQQGWGPVKRPNPQHFTFPMLFPTWSQTFRARLTVDGDVTADSEPVYNISQVSIKNFNDEMGSLIARRIAGIATKAIVADQIRQRDKALGDIAYIAMRLSDQADTRHWSTLPESFQIARIRAPAGKHKVKVDGIDRGRQLTGDFMDEKEVVVKPRKITFLNWRSVR